MVSHPGTTSSQAIRDQPSDSTALAPETINVALIEDNRLVREALLAILNEAADIHAVAEPPSGEDSLHPASTPDVVLLDLGLENGDSLRVAREVMKDYPTARVVVMDLLPADEEIQEFVSAGVSGFIMKDADLNVVLNTIRAVSRGLKVLPDQMTASLFSEIARKVVATGLPKDNEGVRMTPREREVIKLIADGMSNKAIGNDLHISVHTVKSHLRNIMEKLTLHSRLQIAAYAHSRDEEEEEEE
ncbi:MAG: DNA-binding response regulator [Gemmatimonadales bacterium]|nr:MAG: DNA-binding response regulator [Gemmatimonadales bacterium]